MNVLIAGSSSGIGEATARLLAGQGHHVALMARRGDWLDSIADDLNAARAGCACTVAGDVGRYEHCAQAVGVALEAFGSIDALVNAAGDWVAEPLADADPQRIAEFVRTDVVGAMHITRAVLPVMRDAGAGRIVHINGLQGFIRERPPVLYAAVESAVRGLCESLRWEAAAYGVHVGIITLGAVAGDDAPSPPPRGAAREKLSRAEVADAIAFMLAQPDGVNVDELIMTPLGQRWT